MNYASNESVVTTRADPGAPQPRFGWPELTPVRVAGTDPGSGESCLDRAGRQTLLLLGVESTLVAQTGERRFRQADPEDAADVLAIKQAAIESTDGTYSDTQVDAWSPDDDALSTFEGAMEREQFVVLLATVDGAPAGYGVLNVDATRIDAVFVDPGYTGRGLGSSLVGQLETRARMLGLTDLTVVSSRNARQFYESLGYEVTDSRTRTIEGVELGFVAVEKAIDG